MEGTASTTGNPDAWPPCVKTDDRGVSILDEEGNPVRFDAAQALRILDQLESRRDALREQAERDEFLTALRFVSSMVAVLKTEIPLSLYINRWGSAEADRPWLRVQMEFPAEVTAVAVRNDVDVQRVDDVCRVVVQGVEFYARVPADAPAGEPVTA